MAGFEGIDLWGLSEVAGAEDAERYELAAEAGGGADFEAILGSTGGDDRLLVLYDTTKFDYQQHEELDKINIGGNARAPLVVQLREKEIGQSFLFMVNHLHDTDQQARYTQALMLNRWAREQTLPAIAVGTYNFECEAESGDSGFGLGFLTAFGHWKWVKPITSASTRATVRPATCTTMSLWLLGRNVGRQRPKPSSKRVISPTTSRPAITGLSGRSFRYSEMLALGQACPASICLGFPIQRERRAQMNLRLHPRRPRSRQQSPRLLL